MMSIYETLFNNENVWNDDILVRIQSEVAGVVDCNIEVEDSQ